MAKPAPKDAAPTVSQQGAKVYITMLQGLRATVGSEPFTFIINGTNIDSDLAEACFISPAAARALEEDKFVRKFLIADELVKAEDFAILQDLYDGQSIKIQKDQRKPLALLCRRLGNSSLAHFLVGLFPTQAPGVAEVKETTITLAQVLAKSEQPAPSQGTSIEDLSLLAVDEVAALLDQGKLNPENEDALLKLIHDLGDEYTQLYARIRVEALSPVGVASLAENLPYRDLTEPLWQGIVTRLKETGGMS
jgi:hypothetical protein